ncbi:hypothetical protein MMC28_002885 [Mycoblastus sanguinarius]|nr:hypothetical protein [Mycoblastus sanguinarius]
MERLLGLLGRKFGRWTPAGGPDGPGILGDIRQALSISTLEEAEIGGHPFVRWLYPAKDRTPQDLEILTRRLSQSQPAFSIKQYYLARRWFHSSWSNAERAQKSQAHEYLEKFQKSTIPALRSHIPGSEHRPMPKNWSVVAKHLSSGKDTLPAQWLLAEKGFIGFNKESN